uniref:MARVEL domain-containing protein n=1 Tax=Sus scrofa TaxID=9823 RepID=A0A8D1JA49_PIG
DESTSRAGYSLMGPQLFRVYFLRLLQLLSTCVAFSLVASMGTWMGAVSNWSMFIWCFCSTMTIFILIVELCGLQSHFPFSWFNFLIIYTCYAALFCISASIIYLTSYIWFFPPGRSQDHAIAATAFSCIASLAYAMEVAWAWTWIWLGLITGYMATVPGLFKGLEIFMACVIFAFISSPLLYQHQPALVWCVAVYAICFLLAVTALLLNWCNWDNSLPIPFPIFQLGLTLLSVLLYTSALVLWPLYQFDEKVDSQPQKSRDMSCSEGLTYYLCTWDQRLAVAILTGLLILSSFQVLMSWTPC